jgi:hypothetical protein
MSILQTMETLKKDAQKIASQLDTAGLEHMISQVDEAMKICHGVGGTPYQMKNVEIFEDELDEMREKLEYACGALDAADAALRDIWEEKQ